MPPKNLPSSRLKVAIIGAGPAGLGAAISFQKMPFIEWTLHEQATSIREIGAGISIQPSTWRLLQYMGAAKNLKEGDFYRPADNHAVQHRNGRTGELLASHGQEGVPDSQLHARTHRAKLQLALLQQVDKTHIRLSSCLTKISQLASGKLLLEFADGFTDSVDLLVGADGVRSVVRNFIFPSHRIRYIGRTSYRTIVTSSEIAGVAGVPDAVTFWHGPNAWLYTCPLGDGKFEITTNVRESDEGKEKVSWGQEARVEDNARHFEEFAPVVKAVVNLPREIKQYALLAGPRLESVIGSSVALVGDASHPLSGAFGSGAGFALEDVYALTQSIAWAHDKSLTLGEGLKLFDRIRGPYYKRLYGVLDQFAQADADVAESGLGFDEAVQIMLERKWSSRSRWISEYDIQRVMKEALAAEDLKLIEVQENAKL